MKDASTASPEDKKESMLTRKINYATFNARLIAVVLDVTLLMIIGYPLSEWINGQLFKPMNLEALAALAHTPHTPEETNRMLWQIMTDQRVIQRIICTNLIQVALFAAYIIPCWLRFGNTPGKMLTGIEIRDASTYELMTTRQKYVRFLAYIPSGIPIALGFFMALFTKKHQGLHDKIANTIVVRKDRNPFSLTLRSASQ